MLSKRQKVNILLCGGGALGSFLADVLARQGYHSLSVIDFDKVEASNAGTQNFGKTDVGRLKVAQIQANVFRRIGVPITPLGKKLTSENRKLLRSYDLVIDLFDNAESRKLVFDTAHEFKIPCLHAGLASMGYFEVKWNEAYTPPRDGKKEDVPNAPCDYPLAANLVSLCVGFTAEVINRFVDRSEQIEVEFWLDSMSLETRVLSFPS